MDEAFQDSAMTEKYNNLDRFLLGFLFVGMGLLVSATISAGETPDDRAGIDNETCLSCHEEYDGGLIGTGHALGLSGNYKVACVSCHAGGQVHIEDPSKDNITNPATQDPSKVGQVCTTCHQPHPGLGMVGHDPHAGTQMTCTGCHSVHQAKAGTSEQICRKCHTSVGHQFSKRSNHPLIDGTVSCISCHRFLGVSEPDLGRGATANCYSCHMQQSGPFLYEHWAASSFSTEGGWCVECHNPHGSDNDQLLKQPKSRICNYCHVVPTHNTAHTGAYAGIDCLTCHGDIHGSSSNPNLLSSDISTTFGQSCWCHGVN
jgi:DmsE family decaheme c-type cytochrome